jgi:PAS domain S-box-containing protein
MTDEDDATPATGHQIARMERAERVADIGSWEWFAQSDTLVWSDNLFRLHGLAPGEVTPTLDSTLKLVHADDCERVRQAIGSAGSQGHSDPMEYRIVWDNGVTRRLRSTVTAVTAPAGGRDSVVGVVEDVTDEVGADQKITAHIVVSQALDAWESVRDSAAGLLRVLAVALEFHAATLWVPTGEALVARAVWTDPSHDGAGFEGATRKLLLGRGECLPGRVWASGEAIQVVDVRRDPTYRRRDAATRAGLRRAVAIPALHGDGVLAVVELNSRDPGLLGRTLMHSLHAVGSEVGQFLWHRRGELDPPALTPRQLEVLRLAAAGCTGKEIANRLSISATTVKSHFQGTYARLNVSDRASAVAEALRRGLID